MLQHGEYADILRAIGRSLDDEGARSFEIRHHEGVMDLSWQNGLGASTARTYRKIEVERLRDEARALRDGAASEPIGPRAEALRTLGQEIDDDRIIATRILEDDGGLHVAGTRHDEHYSRSYTMIELMELSERRRARRSTLRIASATATLAAPRPWWKRLLGID